MRILGRGKSMILIGPLVPRRIFLLIPQFMKINSWAFRVIPVTIGLLLESFQLWSQTISYDVAKGTMGNHAIPSLGNQAMAGLAVSNDLEAINSSSFIKLTQK